MGLATAAPKLSARPSGARRRAYTGRLLRISGAIRAGAWALVATGVAALAEGITMARKESIPDQLIKDVLSDSFVVSPASKVRLDSLFDQAHPGWFTPALARKDVRLAVGLATETGAGVRIGPATEALLSTVIETNDSWPDFTAVIEALDRT